jgi:uncharacterized protein YkwD
MDMIHQNQKTHFEFRIDSMNSFEGKAREIPPGVDFSKIGGNTDEEIQYFQTINEYRKTKDLPRLELDSYISQVLDSCVIEFAQDNDKVSKK